MSNRSTNLLRRRSASPRLCAVGQKPVPSETPPHEAVQIDGLTVIDNQGVTRLDHFTLAIGPGEIVGVAGVEGNGQSELAAVLSGMLAPTEAGSFSATPRPRI